MKKSIINPGAARAGRITAGVKWKGLHPFNPNNFNDCSQPPITPAGLYAANCRSSASHRGSHCRRLCLSGQRFSGRSRRVFLCG